ncbi:MAG: CaiB/BaiF CoA-transferase family protein [Acidimicrobiia bacterium]|nr:MAG: CaiB/BaiF CoA-transferase family protein [Acidimicrobiia bacterium]
MNEGALDGLRVLDLTRVLAGPLCAMVLGDLGADVLKVERPGRGDDTRAWGPPFAEGESAYYLNINRNKRSLTLNLGAERGREVLAKLIEVSDIVIDNFKLGTMERWGFDETWYTTHAPHVVRCTISGYGSSGPRAGELGYDFIAQAESGLMAITGEQEGKPMKLGVAIVDFCVGLFAAISILAAVEARHRTGLGQQTEVNLHDTGLQMLAAIASNYLISGEPARRYGNGHPNIVPYRTFTAADDEIAVGVGNDAQFLALCEILGHPEWATDPRFARNEDRVSHRREIESLIAERIMTRTRAEWIEAMSAVGIPNGAVNSVEEALSSPHALAREMVTDILHPTIGSFRSLGLVMRMSNTPTAITRHPPTLGEHTDEVLRELGYDAGAVAELRQNQIV